MADRNDAKPRKIWRAVLVLSLALNLAIVGIVAGFGLRSAGGRPPQGFEMGLGPLGQALSREDRREIGEKLRGNLNLRNNNGRQNARVLQEVSEAVRAQPFDPATFEAVLAKANDRLATVQTAARVALAAQVTTMSDEERRQFADRIDEISKRGRRR